jgi:hypothetical protein
MTQVSSKQPWGNLVVCLRVRSNSTVNRTNHGVHRQFGSHRDAAVVVRLPLR